MSVHPDGSVVVLGAGPAGTMAALALARGGVACRLIERAEKTPDRPCGDFLSAEAVARLQALQFPWAEAQAGTVHTLQVHGQGRSVTVKLPFEGRTVRRSFLDGWLLRAAGEAGANVQTGVHVRSVDRLPGGGFRLDSSAGPILAGTLILGNGKHGLGDFHERAVGQGRGLLGWKMNFHKLGRSVARALDDTLCLFSFAGGYGGICRVADDTATVAVLVHPSVFGRGKHDRLGPLVALTDQIPLLAQLLAQSEPAWEHAKTVANLPYGHCDKQAEPHLFPVGDQFAVLPSFTGTGVSFAMASGAAAARHLLTSPADAAAHAYVAEARRLARPVLRTAMPLHRLLQRPTFVALAMRPLGWLPQLATVLARRTRVPDLSLDASEAP
jgi:menaquinone-9 beta-reductase